MSGIGGVIVPVVTGQLMTIFGPEGLLYTIGLIFTVIVGYGLYRSTKRSIIDIDVSTTHIVIMPQATNVAIEISQEAAIEDDLSTDEKI